MIDAATLADIARLIVIGAAPDMPAYLWPLTATLFMILLATAAWDAKTGIIPDPPIFLGLLFGTGLMGALYSWEASGAQLRPAVFAGIGLWAANQAWRRLFRRDCLGMGDAKWTMLAVFAFGLKPVYAAWGCGALLGLLWLGAFRLAGRRLPYIHFAPFLMIGLLLGLWWFRFA